MLLSPKISVVMPVFNGEQYLKESIESILCQTFTDFEFIIVDDQSTDSSWQIIQEYAAKDSRIAAVKNNGIKGCWSARNLGWDLAKGKYLAIMDSDDISLPERLQKEFDFMEQNPDIDICGTWMKNFGKDTKTVSFPTSKQEIRDQLFFINSISQPTVIMRLSSVPNIRYENTVTEDYELWCREIDNLNFANIPEVLLLYRRHSAQTNGKKQRGEANKTRLRNVQKIGVTLSEQEKELYCDLFLDTFLPKNIEEINIAINIFEKISPVGKNFGYGEKFQELTRVFQKKILDCGIQNHITSLKLYFTTFRKMKFFNNSRAHLRYIYHCLRNLLHL